MDDNLEKRRESAQDLIYLRRVIKEIPSDLGHYDKSTAVKSRYPVSSQLLGEALKSSIIVRHVSYPRLHIQEGDIVPP